MNKCFMDWKKNTGELKYGSNIFNDLKTQKVSVKAFVWKKFSLNSELTVESGQSYRVLTYTNNINVRSSDASSVGSQQFNDSSKLHSNFQP